MLKTTAKLAALLGAGVLSSQAFAVLPTLTADPNATANNTNAYNAYQAGSYNTNTTAAQPVLVSPQLTNLITGNQSVPRAAVADNSALTNRVLVSVVGRDASGQEALSPITPQTQLTRGNVLEYRGYITNQGSERVRNMKVTFDIPANMELINQADLEPARAYGSVDGVNFQYMPLKMNVGGVLQDVPMSQYRAVQWEIPGLGLNEVAMVKYRLRVK